MCWVALERAIRMNRARGLPGDIVRWLGERDRVYSQIMHRGWSAAQRLRAALRLRRARRLGAADAAHAVHRPEGPAWLSTLDAVSDELVSDSLVYRYNVEASPDGLRGDEGTFSMCSFWYVEALTRAGRLDEARLAFEKMLTYANHLGLYSEEIGPDRRVAGQLPAGVHPPRADQRRLQPRPHAGLGVAPGSGRAYGRQVRQRVSSVAGLRRCRGGARGGLPMTRASSAAGSATVR